MEKKYSLLAILFLTILLTSCSSGDYIADSGSISSDKIHLNQIGYCTEQAKYAIVPADMSTYIIWNAETGKKVTSGTPSEANYWEYSGDTVRWVDFSEVTTPGRYFISDENKLYRSYEFEIGENLFVDLSKASLKAFYFNRTYIPILEQFGGVWARAAGHPDTVVYIHESAASNSRKEGDVISSPFGWYDAGDYNKYVVNSGITTWTLLSFYEAYPEFAATLELNIPESGNNMPDLLDEALFNLKWVISMQDLDGGVYHKLTNKNFDPFVMPEAATEKRYVVQKTTAATLDFAALLAQAARIYKIYLPEFSEECLLAAKKAYDWAKANPNIIYNQPGDIQTGAYGDDKLDDEFIWAGLELYITTNDNQFIQDINLNDLVIDRPQWADVRSLGVISLAVNEDVFNETAKLAQQNVIRMANELYQKYDESPFKVSIDFFRWGSNSDVAIQGIFKLLAHKFTGDPKYLNAAIGDLDYILGKNATGYSFVTGFGKKQPMNIHHRPSGADKIEDPIPGFLVGGPTLSAQNDCGDKVKRSQFPAKAYVDMECSYATNEIAINWNAPLFYLAAGVSAACK